MAPLDKKLLVAEDRCRNAFCRTFEAVDFTTGQHVPINCHSWRCPVHRIHHGRKWSSILCADLDKAGDYQLLLVNLTTAEFMDHTEIKNALKGFIERFRARYGPTEYVKFVEFNRKQTQPHFHFIFKLYEHRFDPNPPANWTAKERAKKSWPEDIWEFNQQAWLAAQAAAAPEKRAAQVVWNQPPAGGDGKKAASYAVGYVSGSRASKIEEEPGEAWQGRKMSYSKFYFATRPAEIWRQKIIEWFGQRETRFYWTPIEQFDDIYHEIDRMTGEVIRVHFDDLFQKQMLEHKTVKARKAEFEFFKDWGVYFHKLEPGELPIRT